MILILYLALIIAVLIAFRWLTGDRTKSKQTKDFEGIFRSPHINLPTLKFGSSYAWPTFTITFRTKEDCEFALTSGLLEGFKEKLKTYYDKDFDPDRAVFYTYVGDMTPWKHITVDKLETDGDK